MKNRTLGARMGFALRGLAVAWKNESSIRIQALFLLFALAALFVLRPEPVWWALFALSSALVIGAELLNSAIEALCDLVEPGQSDAIRDIKDMAASAVLFVAMASLLIAVALLVSVYLPV